MVKAPVFYLKCPKNAGWGWEWVLFREGIVCAVLWIRNGFTKTNSMKNISCKLTTEYCFI